jgi:glycine/D-amino acid oxidase-like deaminating enzyme
MTDDLQLDRRRVIQSLGCGVVLATLGCTSSNRSLKVDYPRAFSRNPWVVPRISMDAVIRVIVGHRPYRPNGFRVEREQFDDKIIVHNYGHGGGGLSLGWGSSALAVREIADNAPGKVAVVGSGIMGLCTARLLQEAGWTVTIYTRDVYRHTTSNVAAGEWGPFSTHDDSQVDAAFLSRLDWAARVSHHAYTNLTGAKYGIRWMEFYELLDARPVEAARATFDDLYAYHGDLLPGEHPFGKRYARRFVTMQIDPGTLLRQLTADFHLAGGRIIIRYFENLSNVLSLPEPVIFNCTGLGAAALFNDPNLVPSKGQLVFLPPDPAVDYMTSAGDEQGFLHMFPRRDVLLLGGLVRIGDSSRNIETDETERIVQGHIELFDSFG